VCKVGSVPPELLQQMSISVSSVRRTEVTAVVDGRRWDMTIAKPPIVSPQDWARERESLLVAEKELTHALDELAARRRRLPMVELADEYVFASVLRREFVV
jgi:hypothetical protein